MITKKNYLSWFGATLVTSFTMTAITPIINAQTIAPINSQSVSVNITERNGLSVPKKVATKSDEVNLILRLGERKVYVYRGDKLVNKYPVAVGKPGWETPVGEWTVREMVKNPGWTNPWTGKESPPGPDSPLGERWIGFWDNGKDVIGFHGTPTVKSIGRAASHGCVRMYNKDVKVLYNLVKIGTKVKVVP